MTTMRFLFGFEGLQSIW